MTNLTKKLSGFLLSVMALGLVSCSNASSDKPMFDYYPVQTAKDGGWSMVGLDGELLFDGNFVLKPSPVCEGMFIAREAKGFSVYEASKNPQLVKGCEELADAGFMRNGLMPIVRKGSRITYVDKDGKEQFTLNPIDGKEIVKASAFSNGLALIVTSEGKCGLIDRSGNVVAKPIYLQDNGMQGGVLSQKGIFIGKKENDGPLYLIDNSGKETKLDVKGELNKVSFIFSNYGLLTPAAGQSIIIDEKGKEVRKLPSEVGTGLLITNDTYVYFRDGKLGVNSTIDDSPILPASYDGVQPITNGNFFVFKDGKIKIIDSKADVVHDLDYPRIDFSIYDFNFLIAREGEQYFLIDNDGQRIGKNSFYSVGLDENYWMKYMFVESDYPDAKSE